MIKEVIIVEGKDDESAVKRAVDAEIIVTHGFGISRQTYERIKTAYKNKGIIIFTDPDHAGENIRKKLTEKFPEAKHAYLSQEEALKNKNIGIENASPENIVRALEKAKAIVKEKNQEFSVNDLMSMSLTGDKDASMNREKVGSILGIGYGNTKTFLNRLNNYNISREELEKAVKEVISRKCGKNG